MKEHCRSCGAEIFWAKTTQGKNMPIDSSPVEDGTILISVRTGAQVAEPQSKDQVEELKKQNKANGQPHRLFKSHFATCPQSKTWRKN